MDPNQENNAELLLVRAVLNGDLDAFRKLILQYQALVTGIVFRMVKQAEDREDLCQEIFIRVYEKLSAFRFQSKLSTWIANIAFNTTLNFIRKKKSLLIEDIYTPSEEDETAGEGLVIADSGRTPVEMLLNKEASALLKENMLKLSMIQQTVIVLFHREEFSLDEISSITGLPVNTVKSHLHRARTTLKNLMLRQLNS